MKISFHKFSTIIGLGLLAFLPACSTSGPQASGRSAPLRIGVTPDYPPIMFKQGGQIAGVEADLASQLSRRLGRPMEFVEVKWKDQVDSLLSGETDIIMSGMSITSARKMRVAFSQPYHKTGLMTLMRRKDANQYNSPTAVMQAQANVGVKAGTTGAQFVQQNCPNAHVLTFDLPSDAALDLERRRLDLFIHDGPAIAWLASAHESQLTGLFVPMTEENLGWALRPSDAGFLAAVNEALADMKADGTLDSILDRWLPYRKQAR